jgi:hypothetical protein
MDTVVRGAWKGELRRHIHGPPSFKKDLPSLGAFLALLPPLCRVALESRHSSWFDEEVFGLLRHHRAALCIADADGGDRKLSVPAPGSKRHGEKLKGVEMEKGDAATQLILLVKKDAPLFSSTRTSVSP